MSTGGPSPPLASHGDQHNSRAAKRAWAKRSADRAIQRMQSQLAAARARLRHITDSIGLLFGDQELADRILGTVPALDALMRQQPVKHLDKLRRNVALHAADLPCGILEADAAALRRAQNGPRLGQVQVQVQVSRPHPADLAAGWPGHTSTADDEDLGYWSCSSNFDADADSLTARKAEFFDLDAADMDSYELEFLGHPSVKYPANCGEDPEVLRLSHLHHTESLLARAFGGWASASSKRRQRARRRMRKKQAKSAHREAKLEAAMSEAFEFAEEIIADFTVTTGAAAIDRIEKKWRMQLSLLGVPPLLVSDLLGQAKEEATDESSAQRRKEWHDNTAR